MIDERELEKKQDRIITRAGAPSASELLEGSPSYRLVNGVIYQYLKYRGVIYSSQMPEGLITSARKAYNLTNVTEDRSYDADASSTAELADVLGTLIADLRTLGVLR